VGVQWTRLDWTGLESSGLGIAPANLAWQEGHWNPLESTGVHMDYVGEGKDLDNRYNNKEIREGQ
jgi:hypothetical protein